MIDLHAQSVPQRLSSEHPDGPRLLADIGGTNARFALETGPGQIGDPHVYPCKAFAGIAEAIKAYLEDVRITRVSHAAIAIATPVDGDMVSMTNHDWRFSIEATCAALGFDTLQVVNDYTALAMALPYLRESQCCQVGGGAPREGAVGLLGAGTGLGVSGLIPNGEKWIPLSSEGGHVTFAPVDEREAYILQYAWKTWPHVSFERLAAGPGIEMIYQALAARAAYGASGLDTPQIVSRALAGDALCADVLDCFCGVLGTVAGNLALTLGAIGGVYIGGGIVPRFGDFFVSSSFRERFEAKGRFTHYLASIPTFVITTEYPAFLGASAILAEQLGELSAEDAQA